VNSTPSSFKGWDSAVTIGHPRYTLQSWCEGKCGEILEMTVPRCKISEIFASEAMSAAAAAAAAWNLQWKILSGTGKFTFR